MPTSAFESHTSGDVDIELAPHVGSSRKFQESAAPQPWDGCVMERNKNATGTKEPKRTAEYETTKFRRYRVSDVSGL